MSTKPKQQKQINRMFHLFLAEIKKQLHKKTVAAYAIILVVGVFICALYLTLNSLPIDYYAESSNWYERMSAEMILLVGGRLNGFSTLQAHEIQLGEAFKYSYFLENNIQPYGSHSASYLVVFSNYIFIVVLALTMIFASRVITDEYSKKTMNGLLTIPLARWKILLTKFLVIAVFAFASSLFVFIVSIVLGWMFFGLDFFSVPFLAFQNGELIVMPFLLRELLQVCYNTVAALFCSSIAVLLGIITKNGITSCVTGIGIYLCSYVFTLFATEVPWLRFTPFLNVDFSGYSLDIAPIGTSPEFSVLVLFMYMVPLVAASFLIFQKQDIK